LLVTCGIQELAAECWTGKMKIADSTCTELNNLKIPGTFWTSQLTKITTGEEGWDSCMGQLTLGTNYQTSSLTRSSIDRLHNINQLVQSRQQTKLRRRKH
jgi:hypothetical protein